jgi:integrase
VTRQSTGLDYCSGTFVHPSRTKITFSSYSEVWLAGLQVRDSTAASYRCNLRNHLLPAFGPRRLDRISRPDVTSFIGTLQAGHLAPATIRAVVNLLRTILRSAVHDGRLVTSPCYKLTLPEISPKQLAVFTPQQVRALLEAALPEHVALLSTAIGTGLRQGELLGLTADVLDLGRAQVHVRQQMITPAGAGAPALSRLLKTKASYRTVGLPAFVVRALRQHLDTVGVGEGGLLFTNPSGRGWRRGSFNDSVWKPSLRRAGLPTGYGIHATRHTFAAALISAGRHPKEIQAALGHGSIVETMDTYGHLFPHAQAEAAHALDELFGRRHSGSSGEDRPDGGDPSDDMAA